MGQRSAASSWGIARYFAVGLGLGAVVAALIWQFYPGFWKEPAADELAAAIERREQLQAAARQRQAAARNEPPSVPAPADRCAFGLAIPASSAADGKVDLETTGRSVEALERTAAQAQQQGRPRDAEAAWILACRASARASRIPTVGLGDILRSLGDHYVAVASEAPAAQLRDALFARARQVYADSADMYNAVLGDNAARTRGARERLGSLEGVAAAAAARAARPAAAPERETSPARPQAQAGADEPPEAPTERRDAGATSAPPRGPDAAPRTAAAPQRPPTGASGAAAPRPAEPARGRSETTAIVRSDAELAQLDSDLRRLRAQAAAVSEDPAGLQRREAQALAQRDQCRSKACLEEWYARRRRELLGEF